MKEPSQIVALTSQELFLPSSLVKLVLKIGKAFEVTRFDIFSILETLQFALFNDFKEYQQTKVLNNVENMTIIIINIIRLTEKFNKAGSKFVKSTDAIFKELGINSQVYNKSEIESYYKLMKFEVKSPKIVEEVFVLIEKSLYSSKQKNLAYEYCNDVLILFYYWKTEIFEQLLKTYNYEESMKIINSAKLVATSILFAALKILNASQYDQIFDSACSSLQNKISSNDVNHLSAIIFGLIKDKDSN